MTERTRPLAMKPFGRLLASYTVNEIGDSVGIVALAVLVYDRTGDVAPTAALFLAGKFLPALVAPLLTARLDQVAVRRTLPWLYAVEALVFVALALDRRQRTSRSSPSRARAASMAPSQSRRARSPAAQSRAFCSPLHLLREGNALLNLGFAMAVVGGSALAGLLISEFSLAAALLVDAASFVAIAVAPRADPRTCPDPRASPRRRSSASAAASPSPAETRACGSCWAASPSRSSSSR